MGGSNGTFQDDRMKGLLLFLLFLLILLLLLLLLVWLLLLLLLLLLAVNERGEVVSLLVSKGTPALLLKCNCPFDDDDAQNKISAHTHPICTRKIGLLMMIDDSDNDFDLRLSRPSTIRG